MVWDIETIRLDFVWHPGVLYDHVSENDSTSVISWTKSTLKFF